MKEKTSAGVRDARRAKPSIFRRWREQQVDREAYGTYRNDIAKYNLSTLRQMSWVGVVVGAVLMLACLPPLRLLSMLPGYLTLTLLFSALVLLSNTVLQKRLALVLPVFYGFILLLLTLGALMGTIWGANSNAVTFIMFVVVLPLFVIDVPWRLNLVFGVMCFVFCAMDCHVKDGLLLSLDVTNCVIFYLLSVLVSRQTIAMRMSDIIIRKELKRQRDMDQLTKLSNRGAFERRVDRYIQESDKGAIMLIMDLDNFKSVNDQMGHEYGDLVLRLVGEYMQAAFRQGDIVSRLGGDEFVAFLPAVSDVSVITGKIDALIARIDAIQSEQNLSCAVSASVGIARYPQDGDSFQELYRRADSALYAVKRSRKGTYAIYGEPL